MAIFHLSLRAISRSSGLSSCGAAAYRAAESITDGRTGITHDYTTKRGVLHSEIILPAGAPAWATNRADLWNHAELAEAKSTRNATATTAREFNIALPHELGFDANLSLVREFAQHLIASFGVAVDFSIHEQGKGGDKRNIHVHVMLTDRRLTSEGLASKVRELSIFSGGKANIAAIRDRWSEMVNFSLQRVGKHDGIDCRSFKSRGIDREPTIHLGATATALERRGVATKRGDRNREAQAINTMRAEMERNGRAMQAQELTETDKCKGAALSEQHKIDQQKATETSKPLATIMTHDDRIKLARAQAKVFNENRRILGLEYPSQGRDR